MKTNMNTNNQTNMIYLLLISQNDEIQRNLGLYYEFPRVGANSGVRKSADGFAQDIVEAAESFNKAVVDALDLLKSNAGCYSNALSEKENLEALEDMLSWTYDKDQIIALALADCEDQYVA